MDVNHLLFLPDSTSQKFRYKRTGTIDRFTHRLLSWNGRDIRLYSLQSNLYSGGASTSPYDRDGVSETFGGERRKSIFTNLVSGVAKTWEHQKLICDDSSTFASFHPLLSHSLCSCENRRVAVTTYSSSHIDETTNHNPSSCFDGEDGVRDMDATTKNKYCEITTDQPSCLVGVATSDNVLNLVSVDGSCKFKPECVIHPPPYVNEQNWALTGLAFRNNERGNTTHSGPPSSTTSTISSNSVLLAAGFEKCNSKPAFSDPMGGGGPIGTSGGGRLDEGYAILVYDVCRVFRSNVATTSSMFTTSDFTRRNSDRNRLTGDVIDMHGSLYSTGIASPMRNSNIAIDTAIPNTPDTQPLVQLCQGENCNSLVWNSADNPNLIISGLNSKSIRLLDIRSARSFGSNRSRSGSGVGASIKPRNVSTTSSTRAVYGLCVDSFVPHRIASHSSSNQVAMWDLRNFDNPVLTLTLNSPHLQSSITQLEWSPTRAGLLCVNNGFEMTIFDIQNWTVGVEHGEAAVTKRCVHSTNISQSTNKNMDSNHNSKRPSSSMVTSFAWHPQLETCIVASVVRTKSGSSLHQHFTEEVIVPDRYAPRFSPLHSLIWAHEGQLQCISYDDLEEEESSIDKAASPSTFNSLFDQMKDVSLVMMERAVDGYILTAMGSPRTSESPFDYGWINDLPNKFEQADLDDNLSHDNDIKYIWSWIRKCCILLKDSSFRSKTVGTTNSIRYPGVLHVLLVNNDQGQIITSDSEECTWTENRLERRRVYTSESRELIRKLTGGWSKLNLGHFVDECKTRDQYTRAALVSVFCLEMESAICILREAAAKERQDNNDVQLALNLDMIALSLTSSTKSQQWLEMIASLSNKFVDPCLTAMFDFLTATSITENHEAYSSIVHCDALDLADRISFASMYFDDVSLVALFRKYSRDLCDVGDLRALLLTGMSVDGVEVIQTFVDRTGDVQTASLLTMNTFHPDVVNFCCSREDKVMSKLQVSPSPHIEDGGEEDENVAKSHAIRASSQIQSWFAAYKSLLDRWQLFTERVHFECALQERKMRPFKTKQIYVSCTYCGNDISPINVISSPSLVSPLSPNMNGIAPPPPVPPPSAITASNVVSGVNAAVSSPSTTIPLPPPPKGVDSEIFYSSLSRQRAVTYNLRPQSCSSCRGRLPRCSICSLTMGTQSGLFLSHKQPPPNTEGQQQYLTPFGDFFTWCLSCRHGGHAKHLREWFSSPSHTECPVSSCSCRCNGLYRHSSLLLESPGGGVPTITAPIGCGIGGANSSSGMKSNHFED